MKANELMIGDWVVDTYTNKPMQIQGVNERMGEGLEPIPLTPKILEKNGFKNVSVITVGTAKMRWISEDTRTEITIWIDDTMPMGIVKNVYYEDEVSYTLPFPGCVHELQHALRLCGIEKEIAL